METTTEGNECKFGKKVKSQSWDGALWRAGKIIHGNRLGTAVAPPGDTREGGKPPSIPEFFSLGSCCAVPGGSLPPARAGEGRLDFPMGSEFPPFPVSSWKHFPVLWQPQNSNPDVNEGFGLRIPSSDAGPEGITALSQCQEMPTLIPEPWENPGKGENMGLGSDCGTSCPFFLYTTDVNKTALAFPLVSMIPAVLPEWFFWDWGILEPGKGGRGRN